MRICVIGCGAVGSLFAAHLGRLDDVETWAYDVDPSHVAAINETGLELTGVGEVVGRPRATTDPAAIPSCDFGLVATKSIHTESAVDAVAAIFEGGGAICSVQNGVGNEELLAERVSHVIRGTTFPAGRLLGPGRVAWDTAGDTSIGPFEPSPAPAEAIELLASTLTRSGMPTHALTDARGAQWTKLIFNAATNPIGALTALTHGRVCELEPTRRLVSGLVAEGTAVAGALGITLERDPDELVDHAARVAYEHRASMLQDVELRRATEVDFLNGGIVRFGRETGVPTPLNEAIAALVAGVERSWKTEEER